MTEDRQHPERGPEPDELTGPLRDAVEQIRRQPVPHDRMDRSLESARQAPRRRNGFLSGGRKLLVAAASLVAAVGLLAWSLTERTPPAPAVVAALDESKAMRLGHQFNADVAAVDALRAEPDLNDAERAGGKDDRGRASGSGAGTGLARPGEPAPGGMGMPGMMGGMPGMSQGIRGPAATTTSPAPTPLAATPEGTTRPSGGAAGTDALRDSFAGDADAPKAPAAPPGGRPVLERLDENDMRSRWRERVPESTGKPATEPRTLRAKDAREAEVRSRSDSLPQKRESAAGEDRLRRSLTEGERLGRDGKGDRGGAKPDDAAPAPEPAPADKKSGGKDEAKKGEKEKDRPQRWRRAGPPTFARVYLGDGNALELVSLHVTVTVEGSRARTLVDHVFRNPHGRQLEGTFEYPLPTGASPSYFAMFLGQTRDAAPPRFARRGNALPEGALARLAPADLVKEVSTADWGRLQEARLVNKQKALETYEEIVRGRIDPALMEYAGGNTFRGRVFPIPPSGYNRVLIAYEEPLAPAGDGLRYRYALPDCRLTELRLTLNARAAECLSPSFDPKDARREESGGHLMYSRNWVGEGPGGDAVFTFTPPNSHIQAVGGRQGESGPLYVYARVRPELKVEKARPFAKHAVFLLDTSLSEQPDRFELNMKLLRRILEDDADLTHFNVLMFNVGTAWAEPAGWVENTPAGRDSLFARLDGLLLEGATDVGAALDALALANAPLKGLNNGDPLDVFLLSDGQVTWGEADVQTVVGRFEARCPYRTRFNCYRTGLGAENLELYGALTRRGGGVFNCFGPDDVKVAAAAHRSQCLQVGSVRFVGGPAASDVLIAGRQAAVYPGGDLVVAARVAAPGKTQLVVEGTFNGQKFAGEYPVEVKADGELAPRGWGEIAVASLLALNDPKLEALATAYCQEFGVGSRVASFLVLENDADYKRFNLEQERGKTLNGDLGRFLDEAWKGLATVVSARESFLRFLDGVAPRTQLFQGPQKAHVLKLLALLRDKEFDLPDATVAGKLSAVKDVPPNYLAARQADPREVAPYLGEARRRANAGDADGAVRALSCVVEQHPARDDALRLVGYRLLDLKQAAHAARLFARVQRQRPFEPHSYRDLARGLEECGLYGLAAVQYEVVLAGTWHNRFGESLKTVAREEYAAMMREAVRKGAVGRELADHFGERLEGLSGQVAAGDLRVTISWNTDATDVDLWVIEPDGTKCFYQHTKTASGGELSQDQTQGYGPERYRVATAKKGTYKVMVHYYRANPNLLAGETHVNVVLTRKAGTTQEAVERHTVILKKQGEAVEVGKVEY